MNKQNILNNRMFCLLFMDNAFFSDKNGNFRIFSVSVCIFAVIKLECIN